MITRYYEPGLINLYNVHQHKTLSGVLYFNRQKQQKVKLHLNLSKIDTKIDLFAEKIYADLVALDKNHQLGQRLALGLITFSIIGFSLVISPLTFGFISSQIPLNQVNKISLKKTTEIRSLNTILPSPKPQEEKVVQEFNLYIPKINLYSEVVPNVDITNSDNYNQELLNKGVAHAKGSYLPGDNGPVFLFAHSTDSLSNILRYNAKFFYINDLEKGDEINLYFNGKQYSYEITDKKVVNPGDVDEVRNSKSNLILSTCWPLGTDWQRLLIFAKEK